MRTVFGIFCFLYLVVVSIGQHSVLSERYYDQLSGLKVKALCSANDSGIVMCSIGDAPTGALRINSIIEKVNPDGSSVFSAMIKPVGSSINLQAIKAATNGYVAVGEEEVGFFNQIDGVVAKISEQGQVQCVKSISDGKNVSLTDLIIASDGSLVVVGRADSSGFNYGFMAKLDINGNILWSKLYVGHGPGGLVGIEENLKGEYIAVGYTNTHVIGRDNLILRVSSTGQVLKYNVYSHSQYSDLTDISPAPNGGFVACGNVTGKYFPVVLNRSNVLRLDTNGNVTRIRHPSPKNGFIYASKVFADSAGVFYLGYGSDSIYWRGNRYATISFFSHELDTVYWTRTYTVENRAGTQLANGFERDAKGSFYFASTHDTGGFHGAAHLHKTDREGRLDCIQADLEVEENIQLVFPSGHSTTAQNHGRQGSGQSWFQSQAKPRVYYPCDSSWVQPCQLKAKIDLERDSFCFGDTIALKSRYHATKYTWHLDAQLYSGSKDSILLASTEGKVAIKLTLSDSSCMVTDSAGIYILKPAKLNISNNVSLCDADSLELSAFGLKNIQWSPAQYFSCDTCVVTHAFIDSSRIFELRGIDQSYCQRREQIEVFKGSYPNITSSEKAVVCSIDSAQIYVIGANQIGWLDPGFNCQSFDTQLVYTPVDCFYHYVAYDDSICVVKDSIKVERHFTPEIQLIPETIDLCLDEPFVEVISDAPIFWQKPDDFRKEGRGYVPTKGDPGEYLVISSWTPNCSDTAILNISKISPDHSVTESFEISCDGLSYSFQVEEKIYDLKWYDKSGEIASGSHADYLLPFN